MRYFTRYLFFLLALSFAGFAHAQQPSTGAPPAKAPAKKAPASSQAAPKPKTGEPPAEPQESTPDADAELQILVRQAGNDPATLIKNLESYLSHYPDSPRKGAIYRALIESNMTLHNSQAALDYAEKTIVLQPEDSQSVVSRRQRCSKKCPAKRTSKKPSTTTRA